MAFNGAQNSVAPVGAKLQINGKPVTDGSVVSYFGISNGGIQGATALIRVKEHREDLTDKTVRGHTRARDAMEAAPSVAVEIERKPAVEQTEGLLDQVATQLARAKDAVVGWVKGFVG